MSRNKPNPSKRIDSSLDAFNALHDALDLIKAVRAAGLRGVISGDREPGSDRALATKLAEALAALNAAITVYPPIRA